jgi:tetratricopeptide (TPR) repeat protein
LIIEKLPFFALAALASVVTFVVQGRGGSLMAPERLPLGARIGNALISYGRYLGKLFWPAHLAAYYPQHGHWPSGTVLLAGGLILGLTALVWVRRQRFPYLLVGWLWFIGMLVPMIGLVQTGGQAMADRHTYLPSLGVLILLAWGAGEAAANFQSSSSSSSSSITRTTTRTSVKSVPHGTWGRAALSVAAGAAIVLGVALTRQQIGYWQDSEALFRHMLAVTENNPVAHHGLGVALGRKGQTDEAIRELQEALRLDPGYFEARYNLGVAFNRKGQPDEAIRQFQQALRLKPDYSLAHNDLGVALGRKGQIDEAIRQLEEAIRWEPDYADAHYNLGLALSLKNRTGDAIRQFQEALRIKPDYPAARQNLDALLALKAQAQPQMDTDKHR